MFSFFDCGTLLKLLARPVMNERDDFRWRSAYGICFVGILIGFVAAYISLFDADLVWNGISPEEMSYADVVLIVLAGATLSVGALTAFFAVAAIWGWREMRKAADEVATNVAEKVAAKQARISAEDALKDFLGADGETSEEVTNILQQRAEEVLQSDELRTLLAKRVTHILYTDPKYREQLDLTNNAKWGDESTEFGDDSGKQEDES